MGYKKTLGVISIFILAMFALMLTSSYAWYSYNNASTTFNTSTSGDEISVIYKNNNYISTITAVPINSEEINDKADRNNFSVDVNNIELKSLLSVSIDLISVSIDDELKNKNFRYELLYNNEVVSKGDFTKLEGDTFNLIKGINLNNLGSNDFELRVFLLDDGSNQNNLMNKTFRGIINVNVISRVKANIDKQDIDILVSNITIDGKSSDVLPTTGRYVMTSKCKKGSNISWDSLTRTLIYDKESIVGDKCSLSFSKDTNYPMLSDVVKSGDYIRYTGNNGCEGKSCQGMNANYISDTNMGYCLTSNSKYVVNGWRAFYVKDKSTYIVSAGALECTNNNLDSSSLKYCNKDYVYGNICNSNSVRSINNDDYKIIMNKSIEGCYDVKSNKLCGYNNDLIDNGGYYWFNNKYNDSLNLVSWNPSIRGLFSNEVSNRLGLRPVIRLSNNVYVISGNGTYNDPYIIGVK